MRLLLLLALAIIGCSDRPAEAPSSARPLQEPSLPGASAPSSARTPALATSNADETEVRPATETAERAEGACLMWYVCGCNVGCSAIAEPRASLVHGLKVTVASGFEAGKPAFVHQSKDASGADVFSLAPYGPDDPVLCARPDPRLMGYLCEVSKSGDLDAQACDAGCAR